MHTTCVAQLNLEDPVLSAGDVSRRTQASNLLTQIRNTYDVSAVDFLRSSDIPEDDLREDEMRVVLDGDQ